MTKLVSLTLVVVLIGFAVWQADVISGLFNVDGGQKSTVSSDDPQNELVTPNYNSTAASDALYIDGDVDAAIAILRKESATLYEGDVSDHAGQLKIQEATYLSRKDTVAAVEMLIDVYDGEYSPNIRANAIRVLFLMVGAVGFPIEEQLTIEDINRLVFDGRFAFLYNGGEGVEVNTFNEARLYSIDGLEHALEISRDHSSLFYANVNALIAEQSRFRVDPDNDRGESFNRDEIDKMVSYTMAALDHAAIVRDVTFKDPYYSKWYVQTLYSLIRTLGLLERWEYELEVGYEDVYADLRAYLDLGFPESDAALYNARAGFRTACQALYTNDYNADNVNHDTIKWYLEPLYALSDEEAAALYGIAGLASEAKKSNSCTAAFIVIGQDIDPRIQDFLINKVGGWTEAHFEKEVNRGKPLGI